MAINGNKLSRRSALVALAGAMIGPRSARPQPSRPNMVIFLADDLGSGDLGYRGCTDIRTPNVDRLAREGVQFSHAYSNGPVCSPTRAALLTGRYQQRHDIDGVIYVQERDRGLSPDALLLPEILKKQGYRSGLIGKWHLGYPKETFPTRQGFDEFIGFVSGNIDYFAHVDRLKYPDLWNGETAMKDPRYTTQLIGDESVRFIHRNGDAPFLLYVAFSAPHDPFQGPEDGPPSGADRAPFVEKGDRATYARMVGSLDENLGRVMDQLRKQGLDENTAVFFMSDNGGVPAVARNTPFRGFKGSLWEGGIRTPFIARWRGQFPAGTQAPDMVAGMDLFPTCAALASAVAPAGHKLDGLSLVNACRRMSRITRDTLYFHYKAPKGEAQKAMVQRGWKYLLDSSGSEHIFHLAEDQAELNDLANTQAERLVAMKAAYERWERDVFSRN